MAKDLRYEVSQLLELAGIKSPVYFPWRINAESGQNPAFGQISTEGKSDGASPKYVGIEMLTETLSDEMGTSCFGTPIWLPMTFKGKNYKTFNKSTGALVDTQYDDWKLPPTCLVDFEHPHNIVKTEVSGAIGTVKEFFGMSDFNINIRGFLLDDRIGGTTAKQKKAQLLSWDQVADTIKVEGEIFTEKFIFELVIDNMTIKQVEGAPNALELSIEAVSDSPFELEWV